MAFRNGKENLTVWLEVDVAARFKTLSRVRDGGVAQALTRMVGEAIGDREAVSPAGVGRGRLISVRLREDERAALTQAAAARDTTPANWIRSLALVHLMGRPQWSSAELDAIRELTREVRRIGANVNQIARAVNVAAMEGQCPPEAAADAKAAAEILHGETRRLGAILTGNFDYWGLPDEARPTAKRGAQKAMKAKDDRAKRKRKLAPRRRPEKFKE